jgi:Alanine racemase
MRGIFVKGIFSHPPSAEDERVTSIQTDALIEKIGKIGLPIYALNGFGATHYSKYRLSGARAGLSLYGYADDFLPAMKLKAKIVSIKRIEAGDSVGYGGTFTAEKPTDVAVVSVGYADGYPRAMSNVGRAEINGKAARVIGSVTMDMTMLNVTNLTVSVGDTVTLLGGEMSDGFSSCAEYCGTIVYEVLTGVAERVCRIYI